MTFHIIFLILLIFKCQNFLIQMALCVAIYDKNDVFLFLRFKDRLSSPLEVQRFLYSSCDIVADKMNSPGNKAISQDNFLGSLLLSDRFRSYAYLTNTGTKFLLVTNAEESTLKDHEIRLFFKNIHTKYCNAISNPFYTFGTPLNSSKIDAVVNDLFASF